MLEAREVTAFVAWMSWLRLRTAPFKCCLSLDNLASAVTTPLLKLIHHMTETGRFWSHVRKHVRMRADDMATTLKPPVGDDWYPTVARVFVSENVDRVSPVEERQMNDVEIFA